MEKGLKGAPTSAKSRRRRGVGSDASKEKNYRTVAAVLRAKDRAELDAVADALQVARSAVLRAFVSDGLRRWRDDEGYQRQLVRYFSGEFAV